MGSSATTLTQPVNGYPNPSSTWPSLGTILAWTNLDVEAEDRANALGKLLTTPDGNHSAFKIQFNFVDTLSTFTRQTSQET